jgi:hypothetical protein
VQIWFVVMELVVTYSTNLVCGDGIFWYVMMELEYSTNILGPYFVLKTFVYVFFFDGLV